MSRIDPGCEYKLAAYIEYRHFATGRAIRWDHALKRAYSILAVVLSWTGKPH